MKRFFVVLVVAAILAPLSASSAVVGDVDGDGKIELSEAIYALQVASGQYPSVKNSCQLVGKGDWSAFTIYVECDVVKKDGSFYICAIGHRSSGRFTSDSVKWTLLALPAVWDIDRSDIYYNGGNVGIGTSSPAGKLHVYARAYVYQETFTYPEVPDLPACSVSYLGYRFFPSWATTDALNSSCADYWLNNIIAPDGTYYHSHSDVYIVQDTGLVIADNGYVGIGTTSLVSRFAVKGLPTNKPDTSGNAGGVCVTNDGNFWLDTDGTNDCQ